MDGAVGGDALELFAQGLTVAEIAHVLGEPETEVRRRLARLLSAHADWSEAGDEGARWRLLAALACLIRTGVRGLGGPGANAALAGRIVPAAEAVRRLRGLGPAAGDADDWRKEYAGFDPEQV